MSDWHPFVSQPIINKYKYKLANREVISFNQPIIYFAYKSFEELKKLIGIMI